MNYKLCHFYPKTAQSPILVLLSSSCWDKHKTKPPPLRNQRLCLTCAIRQGLQPRSILIAWKSSNNSISEQKLFLLIFISSNTHLEVFGSFFPHNTANQPLTTDSILQLPASSHQSILEILSTITDCLETQKRSWGIPLIHRPLNFTLYLCNTSAYFWHHVGF